MNQLFKDKLILVMLVLGLLTIVSAAGVMTIQKGRSEESPYLNMEGEPDQLADENREDSLKAAGNSQAGKDEGEENGQEELADAGDTQEGIDAEDDMGQASENAAAGQAAPDSVQEEAALVGIGQDDASSLALNFAQTQSMAGGRKCDFGLQHGFYYLFPHTGTV